VGRPFIVGGSRVPVMKMIDAESGCLVDVSFEGHSGPANTRLVMGFLDSFPLARPLALVVKYYLKQRKLNDTYLGGVGSYTLALLVVSFMQRYSNQSQSLPVLLCAFFELYGIKFDYMNTVISVLHGGSYLSKEEKGWQNPEFEDALAVEDPLLPEIDVGYASFNMREVRTAFAEAFDILTRGPVQISPNGAPYHHVLKMSFLRRLINVASKEVSHRKKIRDAYYSSLAKHASQAKAQQRPTAPVAATSSLTPTVTPTQHTVSESKPRRRKPKKSPPKPRGEKVPTSETVALAGANSASAASVGGSDAHSSADVSDASHNSPKSSSNNSSDEGYGSDPSLYDSDKDSSGSEWLAPHDSIHLPEIASDSCGAPAPATTLIKDDANFPTLEFTVGKPFQKPSSMHPPRVA
jgi:DNA polymerase sigma